LSCFAVREGICGTKTPNLMRFLHFSRKDKLRLSSRLEGACDRNGEISFTPPPDIEISPLASLGRHDNAPHPLRFGWNNCSVRHSERSRGISRAKAPTA